MIETLAIGLTVGAFLFCVAFGGGLVYVIFSGIKRTAEEFEDDGS